MMTPSALLTALMVIGAFVCSLFYEGGRDIVFAPALILLVMAGSLTAMAALWRRSRIPCGVSAALVFLLWLYLTMSLYWTTVPFTSLMTWLVITALPVVFFALLLPDDNAALLKATGFGLIGALTILAVFSLIQVSFFPEPFGRRAHYPLADANNLATLFNLGLLPALALFLSQRQGKLSWGLVSLALFAALLATQSRGALLSFAPAFILLLFIKPGGTRTLAVTLAALAGVALAVFLLPSFAERMAELARPLDDPNIASRVALWRAALSMALAQPFTGTGLGTFYLYYPAHRPPLVENSGGNWAHNDALQLWAETGIAAPLLLYLIALTFLIRGLSALPRASDATERALIAGILCALLSAFIHMHATFVFYSLPVLIVTGVWLAGLYALSSDALRTTSFLPVAFHGAKKTMLSLCTAGIALALILMTASAAAGQYYFQRAQNHIENGEVNAFLDQIAAAKLYAPRSFVDSDVQLAAFYTDVLKNADAIFPRDEQKTIFENAVSLLDGAQAQNPVWAEIDYKRGNLYTAVNPAVEPAAAEAAPEFWRLALKKNPLHARARLALAKSLIAKGRVSEAYDLLEQGFGWPLPDDMAAELRGLMLAIKEPARLQRERIERRNAP